MNRILPFVSPQPFPLVTHVSRIESDFGPEVVTAIARTWRPEDLARCKLCDQCAADRATGMCLIQTTGHVSPGSAAMFSIRGLPAGGLPPRNPTSDDGGPA